MKAEFVILGEPKGKGRPRFSTRNGFVKAITPAGTVNYETLVKMEYGVQCQNMYFGEGKQLAMRIFAFYSIPKSKSNKIKSQMNSGEIRPIKKPDMDNVVKIIADSLNGIAYKDDTQIVDCVVRKFYSETPYVYVSIEESENCGIGSKLAAALERYKTHIGALIKKKGLLFKEI